MLKKTLIAAAVATVTAAPAFADIDLYYGGLPISSSNEMTTTTLATVTKDAVLSYSTAEEEVAAEFGVDGDLKQNGFITLQLTGGAKFNEAEVNQWLTTDASGNLSSNLTTGNVEIELYLATTTALGGVILTTGTTAVSETDLTKIFKYTENTNTETIVHDIDEDGTRLRLALKQTAGSTNEMIQLASPGNATITEVTVVARSFDFPDTWATLPDDINGTSGTAPTVINQASYDALTSDSARADYLATEVTGTGANTAATQAYLEASATSVAGTTVAVGDALEALVGANTVVNFQLTEANQIFDLSATSGNVFLQIGALKNASYSADPESTAALFKLGELFDLTLTDSGEATALVSTGFNSYDIDSDAAADDEDVEATGLDLINKTSNQNIQLNKVNLTLTGDLSPFRVDTDGDLLLKDGTESGWTVNAAKTSATTTLASDVLEGVKTLDASARSLSTAQNTAWTNLGKIYVEADNETPIPAQSISVTAAIDGDDQATFEDFSDTINNLFIFTRDGMKFDTILTGTTSANTIHIRDISGVLPEDGGKIYVTVWEYDAHAAGENAESTVLADRQVLSVTLPSKGAVTLNPATIADQLGITVTPSRQARMVFEVETNQGEVAVKKKDSSGIDIQNGTKGVHTNVVDFTL
ncbi:S-layer protein precursor [Vibrio aerogenes CECT 7868]|uniref:S-layer protein n=2 Tax=Vibrio aerogenes TaxID=92172 RepID=A0A1M5ZCF8_9VIBR|nr:S-layer protein precursor [Vibrio aerogenes CECT 7868]